MIRRPLILALLATTVLGAIFVIGRGGGHRAPAQAVASVGTTQAAAVTSTAAPSTTTTSDPGSLDQTNDRPTGNDPAFQARMRLLWAALVSGHVGAALPAFFPLSAYMKVKAVPNPASDWQHRLVADFDADIARVHASLLPSARLMGVSVPDARATWVLPGAEFNRIGYWRVYDTTMTYDNGGRPGSVTVISLISWRGQWYVVHFRTPPR